MTAESPDAADLSFIRAFRYNYGVSVSRFGYDCLHVSLLRRRSFRTCLRDPSSMYPTSSIFHSIIRCPFVVWRFCLEAPGICSYNFADSSCASRIASRVSSVCHVPSDRSLEAPSISYFHSLIRRFFSYLPLLFR